MKELDQESNVRRLQLSLLEPGDLKTRIFDIYEHKMEEDEFRKTNHKNRIPMCQFAFTYFVQHCNGNNDRVNGLYNFINSIKVNCHDSEVALFALIMRNEIEEEFAEVFYQIKEQIEDLRNGLLKKRREKLSFDETGEIAYQVAVEIVDNLYNEINPHKKIILGKLKKIKDRLEKKIKLSRSMKNPTRQSKKKAKGSPNKREKVKIFIPFEEFERLILNLELKSHSIYLKPLISEFRKLDPENHGTISSSNLQELINFLFKNEPVKPYAKNFLKGGKGYATEVITFSDVVLMFSREQMNSQFQNVLEIINE